MANVPCICGQMFKSQMARGFRLIDEERISLYSVDPDLWDIGDYNPVYECPRCKTLGVQSEGGSVIKYYRPVTEE